MSDQSKQRHHFDDGFKFETVRRQRESGKPVYLFAREVGIEQSILHRWIKKYRSNENTPEVLNSTSKEQCYEEEILALKREVAAIKKSMNILRSIVEKSFADRYRFEYNSHAPIENDVV